MEGSSLICISFSVNSNVTAEAPTEIELSNGEIVKVFFEGGADRYRYEVEFENGHKYYYEQTGNTGHGGGSGNLTMEEMDLGEEAIDKYKQLNQDTTISPNNSWGNPLGIVIILVGLFMTIFPYAAWYLEIGWKLRESHPSDLALIADRLGGILASIIGVFVLL
ncbi:DUF6199 family natural product biosynthesis protein [Halobacillus alkaliphilus]|uniref:DUF6199 family natural product biosynthesis protein n=1 Tax=Halobacillus alkaliphilus TaxID=396056 RepID=UPI000B7EDA37|nr:DUF6199 family natural product biosynthesis protein [Halobacillus alkaliphilus]